MAFCGGVFSVGVVINFLINLNFDAWPFLALILLLAGLAIATSIWSGIKPLHNSLIWLADGATLFYFAYISRFSIGLYLFPTAALLLLAAVIMISPDIIRIRRKIRPNNPIADISSGSQTASSTLTPQLPDLTLRERDVLKLIADGKSNQEIADILVISPNTVRHHVHQLLRKLRCTSRTEAATLANTAGWFTSAGDKNV